MFSDIQKEQLSAKLGSGHVKQRQMGGRNVSYIEGWHAIAEANRIFGFDGWTRETTELRCVAERERKMSSGDGWGVTYIARVRITVGTIIREGCGTGHGIDRDLGQAHESALKEAETDAMKRALMTFGNPFGLALYDKTQADVETSTAPAGTIRKEREPAPPPGQTVTPAMKKAAATKWANDALFNTKSYTDAKKFDQWATMNADNIAKIRDYDAPLHKQLIDAIRDRYALLEPANAG